MAFCPGLTAGALLSLRIPHRRVFGLRGPGRYGVRLSRAGSMRRENRAFRILTQNRRRAEKLCSPAVLKAP